MPQIFRVGPYLIIYDDRQAAAVMAGIQDHYYDALRALAGLYGQL